MVTAIVFNAIIDTFVAIFSGGILYMLTRIFKWGRNVERRLDVIETTLHETKKAVENGRYS